MTPGPTITVFVSIGNVDDRLVARQWATFHSEVAEAIELAGGVFQGEWFCSPTARWQTAAWCVDIQPGVADRLKGQLGAVGAKYGTGMVAWSEVAEALILG